MSTGPVARGRPPKPPSEKSRAISISLSPAALAKLDALGGTRSSAIERLILGEDA